jgi:predicted ArsR family transcriptional regulator
MKDEKGQTLLRFFQAVGQSERLKMLGMMANRPRTVLDMATSLGIKETAVQRHLTRLEALDLIIEHSDQTNYTYQLNSKALQQLGQLVDPEQTTEA